MARDISSPALARLKEVDMKPTKARVKEFLSRIEDKTGTVRRYAKAIKNEPVWEVIHNE